MCEVVKAWVFLVLMGTLVYGCAAFTRPHEPAVLLLVHSVVWMIRD